MSEIEQGEACAPPRTLNGELAWRALDTARGKGKLYMGSWFQYDSRDELTPEMLLDENVCGTTACHAGWVVALSGYTMRDTPDGTMAITANGSPAGSVMTMARALLGINEGQAFDLFLDSGSDTIEETIAEIFGPRPESSESGEVPA